MFYVYEKGNLTDKKLVYDIQYKRGYPFFILYENGQWIRRSAKHYIPVKD